MKRTNIKALQLLTAAGVMLDFGDEVQEASQITKGSGPVKIADGGKLAVGSFIMPDGRVIETDGKGIVTKISKPTQASVVKAQIAGVYRELNGIRLILGMQPRKMPKFLIASVAQSIRKPFKNLKRPPSGKRVPFHCK